MNPKLKNLIERALWTFLQAFLSALFIDASSLCGGIGVWKGLLMSAFAAGLSAVKTMLIDYINKRKEAAQNGTENADSGTDE